MASSTANKYTLGLAIPFACWAKIAAAADPSTATMATAQALFDEARRLFDDGHVQEACEKFAASNKIESREGTLFNLALCHQKEGKTASAWVEFIAARARARSEGHPDREKFASDHIDALAPTLTRLRLVVSSEARTPGLRITLDGEKTADAAWNTDIPVDPGPHIVEVSAPGRFSTRKNIEVRERADRSAAVLEIAALSPLPEPSPALGSPATTEAPAQANGQRVLGFSLVGVGVAGVVVGSVFGVSAIDKSHDAQNACTSSGCGAGAQALHQQGIQDAWVSDFAIGGGLLVAAVGAYLGFTAGSKRTAAPPLRASFTGRNLILSGSW